MSWDEIQSKWAAMARRVRSDLPRDDDALAISATPAPSPPPPIRPETSAPPQLDRTDA